MANRKRRQRRIDPDVQERAIALHYAGWSAPKIRDMLEGEFGDRAPRSERTVQLIVRDARRPELATDTDAWTVATAGADEARHVLPVLGAVIDETAGRVTRLRRDHAQWIARIAAALPHASPWQVYVDAGQYVSAVERGLPTEVLDRRLAARAWEPQARAIEAQGAAFARGELDRLEHAATMASFRGIASVSPEDAKDDNTRLLIESARRDLEGSKHV